ncbi:MAG: DUF4082 domain-containing protein [Myxococcus sp.]|nr:DUF4082 domain-containing protein [Myxococcus sp.]
MRALMLSGLVVTVLFGCGAELAAPADTTPSAPALLVRVSSGTLELPVGETVRLNVTVTDPSGATVAGVDALEWSIADAEVASLKEGVLTSKKPGTTTVTVTAYVTRLGARAQGQAVITIKGPTGATGTCGDGTCAFAEACECLNDCGACSGGPTSLFSGLTPTDSAAGPVTRAVVVGSKFRVAKAGRVRTLKFYKAAGDTGTHRGALWSATGQQLAQATYRNETLAGWQQVSLSAPVTLTPGVTYVVSLHSSTGQVVSSGGFFGNAMTQGPLRALADGEDGPNGLFHPSTSNRFPTESAGPLNYFVDLVFEPTP